MCYLAKFGRSALKGVFINIGEPKKWERWNFALLGLEAWLTQRYMPPYMYYHVKFGSSASATNGVRINRGMVKRRTVLLFFSIVRQFICTHVAI